MAGRRLATNSKSDVKNINSDEKSRKWSTSERKIRVQIKVKTFTGRL